MTDPTDHDELRTLADKLDDIAQRAEEEHISGVRPALRKWDTDRLHAAADMLRDDLQRRQRAYLATKRLTAERDAERAARERAEAEARQLREAIETAESVGVDYCTLHHGIRNEDEHSCDFRDDDQESGDDGEPRECVLVELIPRPPLAVVAEGAEDRGQTDAS